ncbi:MAG: ribosomal-processing cysteine protease Prp [Clostridia bacterium]|nr:ribosomal-processing cysteine protease Prp [Clostridia bacterium]
MINVLIKKTKEGIPYYVQASGHALYDDPGKDIVCCAVSTLMIVIANSMELNTKDKVIIDEDDKNTCITIEMPTIKDNKASEELKVLSKTLYLGITQVKEEYEHKYISVKEEIQC